ncbi:MAG TPA: class I SAM-dependent methyltransferase [Thermotogota bacterium]|nr:class I SAM-dependent methyltransferase [Thermotogota bacterium]
MDHVRLFSLIAPFYNLAFPSQLRGYRQLLGKYSSCIPPGVHSVLDLGCGTGAFARALHETGFGVVALDASKAMLRMARWNLRKLPIPLVQGDFHHGLPFGDQSFDWVVAAYVLHGFRLEGRELLYREVKRVSRKGVLFHEFFPNHNPVVSVVEWIEGSDYPAFVGHARKEMEERFLQVEALRVSSTTGWYVCKNTKGENACDKFSANGQGTSTRFVEPS